MLCVVSAHLLHAQSPGFFLDDFQSRSIGNPVSEAFDGPAKEATVSVRVDFTDVVTPVSKYLFGNNANIFMTQMVDQPTLINHIRNLSPNILRFPGGNLSSIYFWNATTKDDLPADVPETLLDDAGKAGDAWPYWYGGNTGSWTMSVDNYYKMLGMTSSTGMITINYGYARYSKAPNPVAAAAHLAANWVRYDNGRTKFWEIGNESNGVWQAGYRIKTGDNHDGQPQLITGALYGDHFKVFADSMRAAAAEKGATIYIGAQLLQEAPASWQTDTDKNWNTGVFQKSGNMPDFYIIHSYYTPYATNSSAAEILNTATSVTTNMAAFVSNAMTTAGVTEKPVALTEWNIFAEGSKQQVSYINGMHAAIVLGEVIRNKYGEASRWDLANAYAGGNDHGMFSQGDEPDNATKWNPRPVYYYMYYFQKYFGDHMVSSSVSGSSDMIAYASSFESGQAGMVVINKGKSEQTVAITLRNFGYGESFYTYTLTGGTDNGEFSRKVFVNGKGPALASGGPPSVGTIAARATPVGEGIKFTAPARSVTYVLVENGDHVITGVELETATHVRVYPNPVKDAFTVEFPANQFHLLDLLDLQGRTVASRQLDASETSITMTPPLTQAVYLVKLIGNNRTVIRKIVAIPGGNEPN
jgi:hypothetical protein